MTWVASSAEGRRTQFGHFLLGTAGIGGIGRFIGPGMGLSEDEGLQLIERAVSLGVKVLDTADVYADGISERVVGRWNRATPASGVLIQSKTGATADRPNLSPARVAAQLENSLKVVGRVDLYLAHQVDPATPWIKSLPVFADAVESGKIRAYGLSNVTGESLTEALEAADRLRISRPEIVQNSYSLISRADDADVLPIVASEGLAYTPYSPLATGVLAGRYSNGERPTIGSRASIASRADTFLADPLLMHKVRRFDALAQLNGISSAGLAIAWQVNHPLVTAPIVAPSKRHQWQSILEALSIPWTSQLHDQLDEIFL